MDEKELLLAATLILYFAYSVYKYQMRFLQGISSRTMGFVVFIAFCNGYVFDLMARDGVDSVEQVLWAIFVLQQTCEKSQSTDHKEYAYLGTAAALNPSNSVYFILNILNQKKSKKAKCAIFGLGACAGLLWVYGTLGGRHYYEQLYFPSAFEPQYNLLWMLYAHMFNRFLPLFQIVFLVLQVSSLYLIGSLNLSNQFKMVLLTYFKLYCNYKCSELALVLSLFVSVIFVKKEINEAIVRWRKIGSKESEVIKIKTLSLIVVIANIAFLALDRILLRKYLNDFTLNIGYLFLFFGFPWILNSIFLAQISLNLHQLQQTQKIPKFPPNTIAQQMVS